MATEDSKITAAKIGLSENIISSLIGTAVNIHQTQQTVRKNQEQDQKQKQFQQELEELRQRNQQQLEQQSFVRQKLLQEELAAYNRQIQLQIAAEQRKTALDSVEAHKLFENWPLRIVPSLILNSHKDHGPIPLRIIPVPPVVDFDRFAEKIEELPSIEKYLAEGLRQFLHQNYSLNNTIRPVELLDGAWDSNRYHGGSSMKALFSMLQSEPILILESEIDGDYLNFRLGYWGLGQANYSYAPIITRLPFREIIYESAKTRAKKWKTAKEKIMALGQDPKIINELDTYNLEIIEQEATLEEAGIDTSKLPPRYRVSNQDFEAFAHFLVTCNCLVAGWIADAHHLFQNNVTPLLPQLLSELTGEVPKEVVQSILSGYHSIYQSLEKERLEVMPKLLLEFANSLKGLPDKSWAKAQLDNSIKFWLKLRGVIVEENANLIEAMLPLLMSSADLSYLENLGECLKAIGDESAVTKIEATLNDVKNLSQSALTLTEKEDDQEAIAALDETIFVNPEDIKFQDFDQQQPKSTGSYQFDVITVDSKGKEIKREQGEAQYLTEELGNGVNIEMVAIPGGTFMMGSPEEEFYNDEKPQHQVTVSSFLISKYPVTQEQWRAIASREDLKVERDLNTDPSSFKGNNHPVEQVSWYDAVEFCQRLSKATRKEYRLPSEAEWEYACRAGTTTPFHFGETISTNISNYDGNYTYGDGAKGIYREKTTPVGEFPPNAFGLYDMHGNVREWCADNWHDNYKGAPTDCSSWTQDGNNKCSPLRGGSCYDFPFVCRSAFRLIDGRDYTLDVIGFRIVCADEKTLE